MTGPEDRFFHLEVLDLIAEHDREALAEWSETRDDVEVTLR